MNSGLRVSSRETAPRLALTTVLVCFGASRIETFAAVCLIAPARNSGQFMYLPRAECPHRKAIWLLCQSLASRVEVIAKTGSSSGGERSCTTSTGAATLPQWRHFLKP